MFKNVSLCFREMNNFYLLLILLLTQVVYAQEKKCSDFTTGEFRYVKENMPEIIIRTETEQIETNPNDKIVVKTSVQWLSECEYLLVYKEILNYSKNVEDIIGKEINCEIIETVGNRIKVHAKSDVMDEILEFIKVN